jgi:hypothetical protein
MAQENYDVNVREAIGSMVKALEVVFKKFSRQTRTKAWKKLTSEAGLKEMEKILQDPNRPVNNFQKLPLRENFKEFLEDLNEQME